MIDATAASPSAPRQDPPILADLIVQLGEQRRAAAARADELGRLLGDLEVLHEPDGNAECPTCRCESPCLTLRMVRQEVGLADAVAAVRDNRPIDLTAVEGLPGPRVPSLKDLLDAATPGVDRFFEALMGSTDSRDRRRSA